MRATHSSHAPVGAAAHADRRRARAAAAVHPARAGALRGWPDSGAPDGSPVAAAAPMAAAVAAGAASGPRTSPTVCLRPAHAIRAAHELREHVSRAWPRKAGRVGSGARAAPALTCEAQAARSRPPRRSRRRSRARAPARARESGRHVPRAAGRTRAARGARTAADAADDAVAAGAAVARGRQASLRVPG